MAFRNRAIRRKVAKKKVLHKLVKGVRTTRRKKRDMHKLIKRV